MPTYKCRACEYSTTIKSNINKHQKSQKHTLNSLNWGNNGKIITTSEINDKIKVDAKLSEYIDNYNDSYINSNIDSNIDSNTDNNIDNDNDSDDYSDYDIDNHSEYSDGDGDDRYSCDYCGKKFNKKGNKERHELNNCNENKIAIMLNENDKLKMKTQELENYISNLQDVISKLISAVSINGIKINNNINAIEKNTNAIEKNREISSKSDREISRLIIKTRSKLKASTNNMHNTIDQRLNDLEKEIDLLKMKIKS